MAEKLARRSATAGTAVDLAHRRLSELLARGVYLPGSRLGGEREFSRTLGVSRTTLRHALRRLAAEGRVQASAQRGWFVANRVVGEPPSVLQSFTEMAQARGLRPSASLLSRHVRPASLDEAEQLGIAPASLVLEIVRLRGLDNVPICIDRTILVHGRAEALADADLTDRSLFALLEELADIHVARSSYAVRACGADPDVASLLNLDPGSPVLVGDDTSFDEDDRPILLARVTYRGDAYRFEATLYRSRT